MLKIGYMQFHSRAQQALDRGRQMIVRCISNTLGNMGTASAPVVLAEQVGHQGSCLLLRPEKRGETRSETSVD